MKRIFAFLLIVICVVSFVSCSNNKDPLQNIKGEELINETSSPDERFLIKTYRNNGGATVDWAVLCTLTDNETTKTKNIYWQYKTDTANIEWIDNDTVSINNVILNLPEDTFDWRN